MVSSLVLESKINSKFIHLGVDNQFGRSAKTCQKLYDHYGIGIKSLISAIKKIYAK
jgi:transketolase C-terminal domain/subunit